MCGIAPRCPKVIARMAKTQESLSDMLSPCGRFSSRSYLMETFLYPVGMRPGALVSATLDQNQWNTDGGI